MRGGRFAEEQIVKFISQVDAGVNVADLCCKQGFSRATLCKWCAKCGGMEASDARRLRELEAENVRLRKLCWPRRRWTTKR